MEYLSKETRAANIKALVECKECDPPGCGQECRGGSCHRCDGTGTDLNKLIAAGERHVAYMHQFDSHPMPHGIVLMEAMLNQFKRLQHALDRDRYTLAAGLNAIDGVLESRKWLREAGRGSYAFDDDRYQQEFGLAFDEIQTAMQPLRRAAIDKRGCTTDPDKVAAARCDGADLYALHNKNLGDVI